MSMQTILLLVATERRVVRIDEAAWMDNARSKAFTHFYWLKVVGRCCAREQRPVLAAKTNHFWQSVV
jgi:hypothetical protein